MKQFLKLFTLLITLVYLQLYSPYIISFSKTNYTSIINNISSKIIRFHIIANSNSSNDQLEKIELKTNLLYYLSPYLKNANSHQQVLNILDSYQNSIENYCNNCLHKNGSNNHARVSLEKKFFPERNYGDLTLPSGYYDSLCIYIGNHEGKNWWCIMYPSLCFSPSTFNITSSESKDKLSSILSEEEYNYITNNSSIKINYKLKIKEWLHR